jgi:hypothetical protein
MELKNSRGRNTEKTVAEDEDEMPLEQTEEISTRVRKRGRDR